MEEAPEPNDIIWENMGESGFIKIFTRLLTYSLSILILSISFMIILYIKKYQIETFGPLTNNWKKYTASGLIFLVILSVNSILHFGIRMISGNEKYSTYTGYNSAIARRLAISKWTNSCLVLVLANYMVHKDDLKN